MRTSSGSCAHEIGSAASAAIPTVSDRSVDETRQAYMLHVYMYSTASSSHTVRVLYEYGRSAFPPPRTKIQVAQSTVTAASRPRKIVVDDDPVRPHRPAAEG